MQNVQDHFYPSCISPHPTSIVVDSPGWRNGLIHHKHTPFQPVTSIVTSTQVWTMSLWCHTFHKQKWNSAATCSPTINLKLDYKFQFTLVMATPHAICTQSGSFSFSFCTNWNDCKNKMPTIIFFTMTFKEGFADLKLVREHSTLHDLEPTTPLNTY